MDQQEHFENLIRRVRNGDAEAAAECVRLYEPEIRRAARVRLTDPRLRRIVDSIDICQSVFGRFFVHAAAGSLEIESTDQLLALLVTMTRHRVTDLAREQMAEKRDVRRQIDLGSGIVRLPGDHQDPLSVIAAAELLQVVQERLTPEEKDLARRRHSGQSWQEIAAELKGTPESLRKRLERAIERVRQELGID
ncbi:MAG: sigma-70 family RNA polymerase sigma factor [Planctomycetaceae bacterium]|nr:sigma-70 family RNA polymerase sigma factor [Planctomycetaceae bacterium]